MVSMDKSRRTGHHGDRMLTEVQTSALAHG
jgi:hypothetical protein